LFPTETREWPLPFHAIVIAGAGTFAFRRTLAARSPPQRRRHRSREEATMNGIIYLIGLIVVIMFILSFLGLR